MSSEPDAIELAERLVDEVARPQRDWDTVKRLAVTLADLAAERSRSASGDKRSERP